MYCILLNELVHVLTVGFGIAFTSFLSIGIKYDTVALRSAKTIQDLLRDDPWADVGRIGYVILYGFIVYWSGLILRMLLKVPRLRRMYFFFHHLLRIPDSDIQSIEWKHVTDRLINEMNRPEFNKPAETALTITSRIMRQENYLTALISNEVLNLELPFPRRHILTPLMETYFLPKAIVEFAFNKDGQLNRRLLAASARPALVHELRTRLWSAAFFAIFLCPFSFLYLTVEFVLRYGEVREPPFFRSYMFLAKLHYRNSIKTPVLSAQDCTPDMRAGFSEITMNCPTSFNGDLIRAI